MYRYAAHWAVVPVVFLFSTLAGCGSSSKSATPSDIEQAKGAVTELRTWSTQLTTLDSKSGAFSDQLNTASASGQIAANAGKALGYALQAMSNAYFSGDASPYSLADYMAADFSGVATGSIVQSGGQLSITNGEIDGNTVNIVVAAPNLNGTATAYKLDIKSATVTNAGGSTSIDKGTLEVKYPSSTSLSDIAAGIYTELPDSATLNVQLTVGQNKSSTVPDPVEFVGQMMFAAQRPTNIHTGNPNLGRLLLSGEFKSDSNSFSAAFDVNMRNAASFIEVSSSTSAANENVTHWRDVDGTLTFTAKLGELPEAQFIEAFDRTAYDGFTGSITIAYGNVTIKLEDGFQGTTETGLKLTLTVKKEGKTAVVGIEFDAAAQNQPAGIVTVNGNKIGTIKPALNGQGLIVTYNDGSFETVTF